MDLKNRHCGYVFCPWCSTRLEEREIDGVLRMACTDRDCGFVFYQNPIPAAGAIVVNNNQVLLVKRAYPPKVGWWCLPAGFMEWDEHPTQTAIRELAEETGLKVRLTSFFEVYSGHDDPRSFGDGLLQLLGGAVNLLDHALGLLEL